MKHLLKGFQTRKSIPVLESVPFVDIERDCPKNNMITYFRLLLGHKMSFVAFEGQYSRHEVEWVQFPKQSPAPSHAAKNTEKAHLTDRPSVTRLT